MAAAALRLPPPKLAAAAAVAEPAAAAAAAQPARAAIAFEPPPYGHRQGFVPRTLQDFGDGGAFPEIPVLQYPLDMGRASRPGMERNVLPMQVDAQGQVRYDLVVRQHAASGQVVHSSLEATQEKDVDSEQLARPSEEEERRNVERTRAALGKLVEKKVSVSQPSQVRVERREPVFIRYTPAETSQSHNSGAVQRIVRVQDAPVDPLAPPKFKTLRLPGQGADEAPAPVLHSPTRKLSKEEVAEWRVPPSISNWKNKRGYTIPLDQRMANDGRGLQEVRVNAGFAKLAEALYIAERVARQDIEERARIQQEVARRRKEAKEEELRALAAKALAESQAPGARAVAAPRRPEEDVPMREARGSGGSGGGGGGGSESGSEGRGEEEEEDEEEREEEEKRERVRREELRREKEREIRRDLRIEQIRDEKRKTAARAREDEDRDVSEKIALGQKVARSQESMFDQRLFNQEQGLSSGFAAEDAYDVFDRPLFQGSSAQAVYRPRRDAAEGGGDGDEGGGATEASRNVRALLEKGQEVNTARFRADRQFQGTEDGSLAAATAAAAARAGGRTKPVEFEREQPDPFGVAELFAQATGAAGEARRPSALDVVGQRGGMAAAAAGGGGGGGSDRADYAESLASGRSVAFVEGRGGGATLQVPARPAGISNVQPRAAEAAPAAAPSAPAASPPGSGGRRHRSRSRSRDRHRRSRSRSRDGGRRHGHRDRSRSRSRDGGRRHGHRDRSRSRSRERKRHRH
jgi:SNW domain-containing protein 1